MATALKSRSPRGTPRRPEGFFRRNFWPHGPLGAMALTVVVAIVCGVIGAVLYTTRDAQKFREFRAAEAQAEIDRIDAERRAAIDEENRRNAPPPLPSPEVVTQKLGPSVWKVETLSPAGQPTEGTAFWIAGIGHQAFLATSLSLVQALTRQPGPALTVRNGESALDAVLWSWQEEWDLAVLAVDQGLDQLEWAPPAPPAPGQKVYLVTEAGALTAGTVLAAGTSFIQHDIAPAAGHDGALLVNAKGETLGMASTAFVPLGVGIAIGQQSYAVPIRATCEKVILCSPGYVPEPGTEPVAPPTTSTTISPALAPSTTRRPETP